MSVLEGAEAWRYADDLVGVYTRTYEVAEPGLAFHSEAAYRERLVGDGVKPGYLATPGLRVAMGWSSGSHRLVAFAYEIPLTTDNWWRGVQMRARTPADFTHETGERTLALIDLAVLPEYQRAGVATELWSALRAGSATPRATLAVAPENTAAKSVYRRWGFRVVGHDPGSEKQPPYDIMLSTRHRCRLRPRGSRSCIATDRVRWSADAALAWQLDPEGPGAPVDSVTVRVPAKINLQLSVGPRRSDGFHELVTVFCAVSLHDVITVAPADRLRVTTSGVHTRGVPTDARNLAVRAVNLLAETAGRDPAIAMHLHKAIPVAGGMAGGSADAAGALLAADALWQLNSPRDLLLQLAARLGSDVSFPLVGGVAIGEGRGERLTPVPVSASFDWVIATVVGGLSTPAVFAEYDRGPAATEPKLAADVVAALLAGDVRALGAALTNDLQAPACRLRPELTAVLEAGRQAGALAAMLSGSGPTCLFLAESASHAAVLAKSLAGVSRVGGVEVALGPVGPAAVVD